MLTTVSVVYSGFENCHLLFSDLGTPRTPYQLLCFAAEHAPADDFNPSGVSWNIVQFRSIHELPAFLFGSFKVLFAEGMRKKLPHLENLHLIFPIDHQEINIAGKVHKHLTT